MKKSVLTSRFIARPSFNETRNALRLMGPRQTMPERTCVPKRISPQWFRQPCLLALHSNEMAADRGRYGGDSIDAYSGTSCGWVVLFYRQALLKRLIGAARNSGGSHATQNFRARDVRD